MLNSLDTLFASFQNSILENQQEQSHFPILLDIVNDERLSSQKRFEVYFNAYSWRLLEILASDYPKLHTLMGDDAFYEMAKHYLIQHPSTFQNVRYFGKFLVSFLQSTLPYSQNSYLAEMATLEWSMSHALDAADAEFVTKEILLNVPLEKFGDIQLHFHPSVVIHDFYWDISKLWQEIEHNEPLRYPSHQTPPTTWLFYRDKLEVVFRSLSFEEALAFKAMQQAASFAEVCEMLTEHMEEETVPGFAAGCLQRWIEEKIVVSIALS